MREKVRFKIKSEILEKRLFRIYIRLLMKARGVPEEEAKHIVHDMLTKAKQRMKDSNDDELPPDYGTHILQKEKEDPKHMNLHVKRKDGVTDEDVEWFWNMHPLERRMIELNDETTKVEVYKKYIEKGLPLEDATIEINKFQVIYGDSAASRHFREDDRPLPIELIERITKWIYKNMDDQKAFDNQMKGHSTMNAFIRAEIRAGHI